MDILFYIAFVIVIFYFVKLFSENGKSKKENETSNEHKQSIARSKSNLEPYILPKQKKLDIEIPTMKDGAALAYTYTVKISLVDKDALIRHHESQDWYFNPQIVDNQIRLFLGEDYIATLEERVDMLKDWIHRRDPYIICFNKLKENDEATAYIAFYRDERKGNEWREQSVVALISYKSEEKQDAIMFLKEGEEVQLEESEEGSGIDVLSEGDLIGKLPAKFARRFQEEGAYAAFVEKIETDDGGSNFNYKDRPFIRIFWNNRAN